MKKELPKPEFDTGTLFQLPQEALKWELLKTAIELDLFDQTKVERTSAEIADELSLHPANTEYALNALAGLGYLSKTDNRFRNTPQTELYLTSGRDTSIGRFLLLMEEWTLPVLNGGMKGLIKNGPPKKPDIVDPQIWERSARLSINHSRCGRAQIIARHVSGLPEFSSFTNILDLGAGPGIIGIAVTAAHPSAECVIFDQPVVTRVADEVVREYGMENRVTVKSGDYMRDDFGSGFELIMANFTLNFYRDRLDQIMTKVHDALRPGGVFMVTSDAQDQDGTKPADTVIGWLPTVLQGNDISFKTGQIARAMLEAGFASTEQKTLTDNELEAHGPMEMIIGRKRNTP